MKGRTAAAATAERAIRREWVKQRREARSARVPRLLLGWAGIDLDISTYNLLIALAERGPLRMTDLAKEVGNDLSTVSRQLGYPEAAGLIRRGAGSKRGQLLELTPEGKRVAARLFDSWDHLLEPALHGWSDDEVITFEALLTRFMAAFRREADRHLEARTVA